MESSSLLLLAQKIRQKRLVLLDYPVLSLLTGHSNPNTLYKLAKRLVESQVIAPLSPGRFAVTDSIVNEFEQANFIYQPSYISLQSALSFYGIISQFPYSVTSITTSKTKVMSIADKEYIFRHIDSQLFWGYEKKDNFLIATPEKALLDSLYFTLKGIISLEFDELDLSSVKHTILMKMTKQFDAPLVTSLVKYLIRGKKL